MIDHKMTRRRVLATGGSIIGIGIVGAIGASAASQTTATPGSSPSASPSASPGASPAASPGASPAAGGNTATVYGEDIKFDPKEFTIAANTDVKVTFTNKGVLQHNFSLDDPKVATKTINGGQSDTVTINAKPGTYQYYCSVPGHKEAGMVGTLTVK